MLEGQTVVVWTGLEGILENLSGFELVLQQTWIWCNYWGTSVLLVMGLKPGKVLDNIKIEPSASTVFMVLKFLQPSKSCTLFD